MRKITQIFLEGERLLKKDAIVGSKDMIMM